MSETPSGRHLSFLCDQNLGRLAKWLRMMGYDTEYMRVWNKDRTRNAVAEGRIVLTRIRRYARKRHHILVLSDHVEGQLRQIDRELGLISRARWFTRCNVCNEPLVYVKPEIVKDIVPEYVYANHDDFAQCPRCQRVYWRGTHPLRIMEAVRAIAEPEERS